MSFLHYTIPAYKASFNAALNRGDKEMANNIAMAAAEEVLRQGDEGEGRILIWKEFFSVVDKHFTSQYQSYDFELADYKMFSLAPNTMLFRGPRPTLAAIAGGNYVTFLGAAQLFGRFHSPGLHDIVAKALKIETLNLSMGGAGPEFFLRKDFLTAVNASKAVVLQVLSGRSVGCDEYPGMRMTTRRGDKSGTQIDRLELLKEIWKEDSREAIRLVKKWRKIYMELMHDLLDQIHVPIVLVWISKRAPGDWAPKNLETAPDFGHFPQLVGAGMVEKIAARCAHYLEVSSDKGLPFGFVSRFNGKKCPFLWAPAGTLGWKNDYYPSVSVRDELAPQLIRSLQEIISCV